MAPSWRGLDSVKRSARLRRGHSRARRGGGDVCLKRKRPRRMLTSMFGVRDADAYDVGDAARLTLFLALALGGRAYSDTRGWSDSRQERQQECQRRTDSGVTTRKPLSLRARQPIVQIFVYGHSGGRDERSEVLGVQHAA